MNIFILSKIDNLSFLYVLVYYASIFDTIFDPDVFGIAIGAVIFVGTITIGPYT